MVPEEFELRTKLGERAASFKVNQDNVKVHLDLGFQPVADHLLNPYIKLALPRLGQSTAEEKSSALGFVFHFNKNHPYSKGFTSQFELAFDPTAAGSKLSLRKKLFFDWKGAKLELYNQIEASKTTEIKSTISALSPTVYGLQGLFQANFLNYNRYTGFDLGFSYQYSKWVRAYFWNSNLDFENPQPTVRVGMVYTPHEVLPEVKAVRFSLLPTGALSLQAESSELFGWLRVSAAVDAQRDASGRTFTPRLQVQTQF